MSKTCSRCDKAVYPTEELKCLDKLWHKTCFKCQTCGMALNMKTYKGYNKLPYCEAHIPKAKATTVTETPEMRRLAENTKLQSQVQYHADFEKAKGKFTQVADDPETLRIKANTKIISNVSYHGELEKKAAMEQKRTLTGDEANGHDNSGSAEDVPDPVAEVISQHQQRSVPTAQTSPSHHYQHQQQQQHPQQHHYQYQQQPQQQLHHQQQGNHHLHQSANHRQPDFKTVASSIRAPNTESSQNSRPMASSTVVYCSQPNALDVDELVEYDWKQGTNQAMPVSHDGHFSNQSQGRRIGSINDYDPVNENHGSQSQTYRVTPQQQQQPQYMQQQQTQQQKLQQYYQQQQRQHALHVQQQQAMQQQAMQQQQAIQQQQALQQQAAMQHQQAMQQQALQHQHSASQQNYAGSVGISSGYHQAVNAQSRNSGRSYRAMYDYDADDDDEVSFRDGDVIVDCKSIDEGWMMGTVLRTGRSGMVPANYIEPIN